MGCQLKIVDKVLVDEVTRCATVYEGTDRIGSSHVDHLQLEGKFERGFTCTHDAEIPKDFIHERRYIESRIHLKSAA